MHKTKAPYPLLQAMPFPGLLLKPEEDCLVIIDANESYLELVQAKRQDLIGVKAIEAFPHNPDQQGSDLSLLKKSFERVARSGKKEQLELRYDLPVRDTGEFQEKHWSCENLPVFGEDAQVEFVLHVVKDITAQVLDQKQRQQLELQQRHFIENSFDGLYSMDVEGNFTSANEGLAKIAGLPLPELLKTSFLPFCHPEDQEYILQHFHKAIAGETSKFEARFISAQGRDMILQITLIPMKVNEKIEGAYGITRDITSIYKSRQVIVEKKNFLKANAAFIGSLLDNENLENDALQEVFGIVGKAVGVDRMYYFASETSSKTGQTYLSQQLEWCSEQASPQINNPDLKELSAKELQQELNLTSRNEPYTAFPSKLMDGKLKRFFLEQDVKSVLILPIFLKGALHGFIGFDDCTRERQWSEEEMTFLQSLADNFTAALEKRSFRTILKQREEALLSSEKKFRALVQEGSDLIGILDLEGNYKFVSESSTRILGISPETFLGKNAFDFFHPEDKVPMVAQFALLEKEKQVNFGPFRFKDKDNNWRWIETTATNMLDEPAINGIVTNSRDITTIYNQSREIEQINERYRLAATATRDLMYDWDLLTGEVKRFHKTASFEGYLVAEINERSFWRNHVHPDELKALRQQLKKTLKDPDKTFINSEYRFQRADGTYAQFLDRAYIIRDANGEAIRLVGATSDISELTAQKEALKEANQRFEMAMKATNEMIWDWDIATDHVNRSMVFNKIYGYNKNQEQPSNAYWLEKIHPDEREAVKTSLRAALEDSETKKWQAEYRVRKASGDFAHVVDRGYILRDETGKAYRVVGAVLDVTSSNQALRKIEEQNRRLREIAWEQSHVVRAPLARLQGLLELVKTGAFEEMSYEETWSYIEASANELDQIIRKIVKKTEEIDGVHI